jgi:hypothetical protein
MNTTTPHAELAERLVDSDLIAPRTQRAILSAFLLAGADRVQPKHFISAAKEHRATVRIVAAGTGWLRCLHCAEWRDIGAEPCEDLAACPCCLEVEDDAVFAGLMLYLYADGPIAASIELPASVRERMERYRQSTGGAS